MGISFDGLTTSLTLSNKRPNNKQKARIVITDINNQDFRNFLKEFKNSPYLVYKRKKSHNERIDAYFFLFKHIFKSVKTKNHVRLCTKGAKSDVNRTKSVIKTVGHVNKNVEG